METLDYEILGATGPASEQVNRSRMKSSKSVVPPFPQAVKPRSETKKETATIPIVLPRTWIAYLKDRAEKQGIPMTSVVRHCLAIGAPIMEAEMVSGQKILVEICRGIANGEKPLIAKFRRKS
jgi:hypothetical protein